MKIKISAFGKAAMTAFFFFLFGQNIYAQFTEGEYYTIISALTDELVLDVEHASTETGANLIVGGSVANDNQLFQFQYAGGGYWYILSRLRENFAMDVDGGKTDAGTNVHLWDLNKTNAQKFKLVDAGGGYYYIQSAIQPDYVLDVSGANKNSGTNIWMYPLNRSNAQKFKLEQKSTNGEVATFNDAIVNRPAEPITISLQNNGDFIADFTLEYQLPGYLPTVDSYASKRYKWNETVTLPANAVNITVGATVYTDFGWDKKKTVIDEKWLPLQPGQSQTVSLSGNYNNPKSN